MIPKNQVQAVRPESRAEPFIHSENREIPPWYEAPNPQFEKLALHTSQAAGRDKAMDMDNQDKVNKVICQLKTLKDLFDFYCYAYNKTGFTEDSITGLHFILSDCINDLKEAVK